MQLFFEEDGVFKAGNVLKKDGTAYQAELPTGRRTKVKGGHVFFEFDGMSAAEFMEKAQATAAHFLSGRTLRSPWKPCGPVLLLRRSRFW